MAEHTVQVQMPSGLELTKSDLVFEVDADGERFGKLTVSKGGIGWWPRDATEYGTRFTCCKSYGGVVSSSG